MIRALETRWNGRRFRSRTEARWAVFFDALDIPYEYEREGFALPSGNYLPDFWLPEQDCWIEIKGTEPTKKEGALAFELGEATQKNVYLFVGHPPSPGLLRDFEYWDGGESIWPYWDNLQNFCVCNCGKIGIEYEGRGARLCRHDDDDRGHSHCAPMFIHASALALSERFGT